MHTDSQTRRQVMELCVCVILEIFGEKYIAHCWNQTNFHDVRSLNILHAFIDELKNI